MTEQEIIELGLIKEDMRQFEGDDTYYYAIDIVNGLTLITPANDEVKNNDWFVEILDTDPTVKYHKKDDVQRLINLIEIGKR